MIISEIQKPKMNRVETKIKKPSKPDVEPLPLYYDLDYLNLFERASIGDEHARELLECLIASDS